MGSITNSKAAVLASYVLNDLVNPLDDETREVAMIHRMRLVESWGVKPGMHVLELGFGHGDTTIPLADAVGQTGHITAVDPGPDHVDTPPLGKARAFMAAGPMASRITMHVEDPVEFLQSSKCAEQYDAVVLAHCIWFFDNPKILPELLTALRPRASSLMLAEYSLHASTPDAWPHVLAALLRNSFEVYRGPESRGNIKTAVSPTRIKQIAAQAGWRVGTKADTIQGECMIATPGLKSGSWEVAMALFPRFEAEFLERCTDARTQQAVLAIRDTLEMAVRDIGGADNAATMDTWVATFYHDT